MADLNLTYNLVPSAQVPQQLRNLERTFTIKDNVSPALGRISHSFSQFDKSLDASNARVLAFGASAGLVLGVQRAFSALVRETIGVEKALKDINVILGLSNKNLSSFGSQLFDIAKNTGQTFASVAEAAKELSRQGLSAQETLRRTQDALILTRQSGLDAEESVKAITSALNSFQKEALTSTQVINKLSNVDANFAVSSKDLANAITRTGSAAEGAGVKFDELIGLVTAAQQITQRGGAVIAQALNSVFARISRPGVLEQLKELGVQIEGSQTGIEKLRALSVALSNASQEQADMIKDAAGGVRNLNVLSAVLGDLQNKYSFVARATQESVNATDQAIQRNEELNKTYATLTNRTIANIQQVSAQFGKLTIGPGLENVLGKINQVLEGSLSKNSDGAGEIIGKGILKGLGEFIGGPGLILVTAAIGKLVQRLALESASAFKTVLGLNKVQNNINSILQSQPALINRAIESEKGLLEVTRLVNNVLKERTLIQSNIAKVSPLIAAGIDRRPKAAVGLIPALEETAGAINGGYRPGQIKEANIPNYGRVVYNTAEKVKYFPGFKQPAIMPPQNSKAGVNYNQAFMAQHGFSPYASGGLVPNYAGIPDFQKLWGNKKFENIKYALSPDKGYTDSGKDIAMYLVSLESKLKGKGNAKKFLQTLTSVADSTKTPLSLIPEADLDSPGALNQSQLENFYKKFGFDATQLAVDGKILEMLRMPKSKGLIPSYAISGRGISNSNILERLRAGANKGSYFSDFYDKYESHNPLQGGGRDLFNKIYAGLSFGADDRLVFNQAIDIFKGAQSGQTTFDNELAPLGLGDVRKVILNKILKGSPLTSKKTGVYYDALSGNKNALAIDRNFINTALNTTLISGEKISSGFRDRLKDLVSGQLAPSLGLDPRAIQAAVFAGRSKFRPSFDPFARGFERLSGSNGFVPSYAYRYPRKLYAFGVDTETLQRRVNTFTKLEKGGATAQQMLKETGISSPEEADMLAEKVLRRLNSLDIARNKGLFEPKQVPNYALSLGVLKSAVKQFKQSSAFNQTFRPDPNFKDSPYAEVSGFGMGNLGIPKGTSGEAILHEIGHIFSPIGITRLAPTLIKERTANKTAREIIARAVINKKGSYKDLGTYNEFATAQIKNYKIGEIQHRLGDLRPELRDDQGFLTDTEYEPVRVRDLHDIKRINAAKSKNLRNLIQEIDPSIAREYIAGYVKNDPNFSQTLGAKPFNSGFVPNYAMGNIFSSARLIGQGLSKFGSGVGVKNILGLVSGKVSAESLLPSVVKFISEPTNFVKTQQDLEAATNLLNTVTANPKINELLANQLATRVRTTSFEHRGLLDEFEHRDADWEERSAIEHYAKYRLFGGQQDFTKFLFTNAAKETQTNQPFALDRASELSRALRTNRDGSTSFTPGTHQYNIIQNSIEEVLRRNSSGVESVYGTKLYGKNQFIANTHLLGRFTGRYNKSKTLATYHDKWDVALHPPEQKALQRYLSSGDQRLNDVYADPSMSGGTYGSNINSLILREIISKLKTSNPITFRGAVKLRPENLVEDNLTISRGLIPSFSPLSDAIAREAKAGVPATSIRIGSSPLIRSPLNPAGLGVYNTQDEPGGLGQGISRAIKEGRNPKTYGVPNFAEYYYNVPQTIPSPQTSQKEFTARLPLNQELQLEQVIKSLKLEAKITALSLSQFSDKVKKAIEPFGLITQDVQKIDANLKKSYVAAAKINQGKPASDLFPTTPRNDLFGFGGGNQLPVSPSALNSSLERALRQQAEVPKLAQARIKYLISTNQVNPASFFTSTTGQYSGPAVREIEEEIKRSLQKTNPTPAPPFVPARIVPEQFGPGVGPAREKFLEETWRRRLEERNARRQAEIPLTRGSRRNAKDPFVNGILATEIDRNDTVRSWKLQLALAERKAQIEFREAEAKRSGLGYYDPSTSQPTPKSSFLSRFDNIESNPKIQNAAIASSFILPILGATIAELVGDKNTTQRGVGQTAQSLANVGSYTAIGATFGGVGGLIGAGVGLLSEAPRVMKAFTDKVPDLQREIEKLTERINKTNEGFSNIIVTNEKFKQYQKGELDLSPIQYGQLKLSQEENINNLSVLFPKYAKDIRQAATSGDANQLEKVNATISSQEIRQLREQQLGVIRASINKRGLFGSAKISEDKDLESYTSALLSQRNIDPKIAPVREFLLGDTNLLSKFESAFGKITKGQKSRAELDKYLSANLSEPDEFGRRRESSDFNQSFVTVLGNRAKNAGTQGFAELTNAIEELNQKGFTQFKDTVEELTKLYQSSATIDQEEYKRRIDALREKLNTPELREALKAPTPNRIDNRLEISNFIKSLIELDSVMSKFIIKLDSLTERDVAKIQNNLSIQTARIQAGTSIEALRKQYNPYAALDITNRGAAEEIDANSAAQLAELKVRFTKSQKERSVQGIQNLSELLREQVTSNESLPPSAISAKYETRFRNTLTRLLPGAQEYLGGGSINEGVKTFLESAPSEDIAQFYKNLENERDQLYSEMDQATPKDRRTLGKLAEAYTKIIDANAADISKYKDTIDLVSQKSETLKTILSAQSSQKRAQIIENIVSSYSDISDNLDGLRAVVDKTEEFIQNRNLTGRTALRTRNFQNTRGALLLGKQDYAAGELSTAEYRQRYLMPAADAELAQTGKVSNDTLKDLFKSGFGYNQRDYFEDLKNGVIELSAIMKQSFGSAFESFVNGSKSAEDAARQLGITIATNILNKVAQMGFDSFFGSVFGGQTGFFSNLFGGKGKSHGGIIGYNGGGVVRGGSGLIDDVPAMLSQGAFVVKKSSTNKYGKSTLDAINYGRGFAGGGINQVLKNNFVLSGKGVNTKGSFDVDPSLSVIGQTDENNPHNAVKFGLEQDYVNYLGTIKQYKQAKKEFENAAYQRLLGAYISAGMNIGGGYLQSWRANRIGKTNMGNSYDFNGFQNVYGNVAASGGLATSRGIRRFAYGGAVDTIPALLTGGEYVMNPDAVNRMGVGFMDRLNAGLISPGRYASGGLIGRDVNTINPIAQQDDGGNNQIASALLELVKINKEIRDLNNGTKPNIKEGQSNSQENSQSQTSAAPQINITIQVTNGNASSSQTKEENTQGQNGKDMRELAKLIEASALKVIIEQQRDNGVLSSTRKKS